MCSTGDFIGGVRTANGNVCYTGTTPGGGFFAQTFCDQGYKPESSQRRVCQIDGSWSGSIVPCVQQGNSSVIDVIFCMELFSRSKM